MEARKVLLFGAGGLVGRHFASEIPRAGLEVRAFQRVDLDIRDTDRAANLLEREKPEWLINAAAICNFDLCEDDPDLSRAVNLDAPLALAKICGDLGIRMCQFSSDYVFTGDRRHPYDEEQPRESRSVYGRHKAEMERGFERYSGHLVPRLSWVFGQGGRTFMSRLPGLLMKEKVVRVAAGKRGSCLYAADGARMVLDLMIGGASGLVNVVNDGEAAWEWFARECLDWLRSARLNPACEQVVEVPFEKMATFKPGRPEYSVLDTAKLAGLLRHPPRHWKAAAADFSRKRFAQKLEIAGWGLTCGGE